MTSLRLLSMALAVVLLLVACVKLLRGKKGAAGGVAFVVIVLGLALMATEPVDR